MADPQTLQAVVTTLPELAGNQPIQKIALFSPDGTPWSGVITPDAVTVAQSQVTGLTTDLAGKVPTTRTVNGHALTGDVTVTKADLGLGSVDNTSDADKPISTATQAALDAKVSIAQAVNAQTGTTYTLAAADATKLVTLSNAGAITLTVPQDSDAAYPLGAYTDLMQLGVGQVTIVAGTGATLLPSALTAKSRAQYSRLGVQKVSADTWSLYGDLAAS